MKSLSCCFRLFVQAACLAAMLPPLTASAEEAPAGALKKEGPPAAQTAAPPQKDALQTQAEQESGAQTPSQEVIRPQKYRWADDDAVKPPEMPSYNPFGMAQFPEFHFAAHDQGTLADLCRALGAAAGPKTKIYLDGEAMKIRVPDLTLKNTRVGEVLDAVKLANPRMTWKWDLWDNLNEYYVGMLAPASAIVCHVFRLPALPPGNKAGKEAAKNRNDPMTKMFDHIYYASESAIRFRDKQRRIMTHEILPVAGFDMELHPATRLLLVASTPENMELVGTIVKDVGGEDLGPAASSSPPLHGAASLTTLAPSKAPAPRPDVPDADNPALPEFSFEGDLPGLKPDQGNIARFCEKLAAAAGPKTRIYLSSEAMTLRAPNVALKNVHVEEVLHALTLAEPRVGWTYASAPDCLATNPDGDATIDEYYVGVLAPASSIVCHLFRVPEQPLDKSGGSAALEKRQKAFGEMYMLLCSEALKAIYFRDDARRVMTHDILPMARFDMEGQGGDGRILTAASTQENIELTSVIVRALGGEDLGPVQSPLLLTSGATLTLNWTPGPGAAPKVQATPSTPSPAKPAAGAAQSPPAIFSGGVVVFDKTPVISGALLNLSGGSEGTTDAIVNYVQQQQQLLESFFTQWANLHLAQETQLAEEIGSRREELKLDQTSAHPKPGQPAGQQLLEQLRTRLEELKSEQVSWHARPDQSEADRVTEKQKLAEQVQFLEDKVARVRALFKLSTAAPSNVDPPKP